LTHPGGLAVQIHAANPQGTLVEPGRSLSQWAEFAVVKGTARKGKTAMLRLLASWILSAVALLIVSRLVSGFHIQSLGTALIAALVFGLLNATLGLLLKLVTLPLSILTLGIFLLVVNAFILKLASGFVPGFRIADFGSAFWGAAALAVIQMLFRFLLSES
jgi:putative membrane protein